MRKLNGYLDPELHLWGDAMNFYLFIFFPPTIGGPANFGASFSLLSYSI